MTARSRVIVLHDALGRDARPDELDTLDQVASVTQALRNLGHEVTAVPFGVDPSRALESMRAFPEVRVFNLVESVDGDASLNHLAPAWLEHWRIAYTGCSALAHLVTTDKLAAKVAMQSAEIPTPAWYEEGSPAFDLDAERVIFKPVREDASLEIDEASVVDNPGAEVLRRLLAERSRATRRRMFAEAYVDGREYNLALVGVQPFPEVLPPAEIRFLGYEERSKPKVVGYAAKWLPRSYEYTHTVRSFAHAPEEQPLLALLSRLACQAWQEFGLRGYARVDFRVDAGGNPWVLEVNPNPCLAPGAGVAAAAEARGWTYDGLIARILAAAIDGGGHQAGSPSAVQTPSRP